MHHVSAVLLESSTAIESSVLLTALLFCKRCFCRRYGKGLLCHCDNQPHGVYLPPEPDGAIITVLFGSHVNVG
jgi:hypothetical protein